MPLDGVGIFNPPEPEFPAVPNTVILSSDFNTIMNDVSTALSTAIYKDGQAIVTANIPFNSHKLTQVAAGVADTDATNFDQVFHNPNFVGSTGDGVVISGTKGTVSATEFIINSTTLFSSNDNVTLNATGDIALNSVTSSLSSSTSITLTTPTLNIQATTTGITGTTTANLSSSSTAVTQAAADGSTKIATTAYVDSAAIGGAFPVGSGNNHKFVSQDAGVAGWFDKFDVTVNRFADGTDATKLFHFIASGITAGQNRAITVPNADFTMTGNALAQTLTNKTINIADNLLSIQDDGDATKQLRFNVANIAASTIRTVTPKNENIKLFTPAFELLSVTNFSGSSSGVEVDCSSIFTSEFEEYMIKFRNLTRSGNPSAFIDIVMQVFIGGAYITSGYKSAGNNDGIMLAYSSGLNAADVANATVTMFNPRSTTQWKCFTTLPSSGSTNVTLTAVSDSLQNTGAITKFKISTLGTSNIASVDVYIFGVRNS